MMSNPNFFTSGSPYLNHPLLTPERTGQEIDFVLEYIHVVPGGTILDVGCGHGRHSVELAQRGFQVVGIDPSAAMIEAARARASEAGVKLKFIQARGEAFSWDGKFDGIICLFTTLGQIDEDGENSHMVAHLARMLRPGGTFIVEVPNPAWVLENLKTEEHFGGGEFYTNVTRQYQTPEKILTEIFNIVSPTSSKKYLLRYRLFDLDELYKLLSDAGFQIIGTYGGYTNTPLKTESPITVAVSQLAR